LSPLLLNVERKKKQRKLKENQRRQGELIELSIPHPLVEWDIGYLFKMAKVPSTWQSQPFVSLRRN
jgi:hypothetical protein